MRVNNPPKIATWHSFPIKKLSVVAQLKGPRSEGPRRGRTQTVVWMKSEVWGTSFLPTTSPSFGGYIRADETSVEIPQTRKVAANQIPAMCAVCVDIPLFCPLFLSLLFSQFLRALSTSMCVFLSLPLSLLVIWIWSVRGRRTQRAHRGLEAGLCALWRSTRQSI